MKVPLLDLQPQTEFFREQIIKEITEVVDSTCYILGPKVAKLEQEIAEYSDAVAAIGVSSGTDALVASLMALELQPGDQVLTTPYTFFATMGSIIRVGAVPVFADVDARTLNLDPAKAAEILEADAAEERKIKAIMPVHLFGQCADMFALMALAHQYEIPVIEDAAQAIGAEYPLRESAESASKNDGEVVWKKAGSMGLAGCFSFFPSKNLGCMGDGGMITTCDSDFAETLRCYRNHGAKPKYYHSKIGGNFRLDPLQAAVLSVKLPYLEKWHQQRRENSEQYRELFAQAGLIGEQIALPEAIYSTAPDAEQHNIHIYNQFVIRTSRRDALRQYLQEKSIGCEVYYPVCLHQQKCLESYGTYNALSFPVAEQASRESLALPIYPELSNEQQEYVVDTIADFFRS
ncbi:dTDP-4-amino-4,6-dideoxygalactose transaminase [Candidatus Electrothrix aarhusensis]|uniref:dTDP-4-amino-4,6-dideoxygalactose transaminase n=1 Tax=Candidatus Electrothrix aarhusensis TaxID=1859131 RepID=A0A444IXM0_9BACT|nr:dTDP-4-amino-4,6-dideoxygalactose transaminase [Candidatus Electrothrix aarhusensis]